MVTLSFLGYLKETSTTLMRALPLDLTPSIGPGLGKWNFNLLDFSSKYALASGRTLTKAAKLPLKQASLRSAISRMWLQTSFNRPESCDTMMHVTFITSRWFVGSSMSRMSAFWSIARESASFMRHPPLSVVTGSAIIFFEKPTFSIISATSSLVEPQAWMRGSLKM